MIGLVVILIALILGYFFLTRKESYAEIEKVDKPYEYISSDYNNGDRGTMTDGSQWEKIHNESNDIINDEREKIPIDMVLPSSTDNLEYHPFKGDNEKKIDAKDPKELYNVDNYLPQETNDDYFDQPKEPIPIKNRNLINTHRSIGVDTIGSSRKEGTLDIRGQPVTPKMVVSPFLNSSIDPPFSGRGIFD